jgi:Flp pilus assembly protein TadB
LQRSLLALGVVGFVLAAAAPAAAAPPTTLAVSGLHESNGVVEFYLTARDLPAGTAFDRATVTVRAGGVDLPATATLAQGSPDRPAPRRVAVLVLDASGSMAGAPLASAKQAALTYLDALPGDVQVGVVTVATTAAVVSPPTADRSALTRAVDGIAASGRTALYDGIAAAARLFGTPVPGEERRILVLSDGADTASRTALPAALSTVDTSRAVVDAVAFRNAGTSLQSIVAPSGGHRYTAADGASLATAFRTAAGSFSSQLDVTAKVPAVLAGRDTRLEITATVAGTTAATSVPVSFDADPRAVAVPQTFLPRQPDLVWYTVIGGLIFLALLAAGLVLFAPLIDFARHRRRLSQVDAFRVRTADPAADRSLTGTALAVSARVVRSGGLESRIADQLDHAGVRMSTSAWPLMRVAIGVICGLLLGVLFGPLIGVLVALITGWLLPWAYLRNRVERRQDRFAAALPDALQLVIGSLRSGFSLPQAIDAMAREAAEPVSSEFARALAETRLGVEMEDALSRVSARMASKDLAWAVVAIRVQREVGGNLAEVLSTTVATMREREALRRHVRGLAAEGRLSAYILIALPLLVALVMLLTRPSYLAPLVTTALGIGMLIAGIVLMVLGTFWMTRIVKVEV